MSGLLRLTAYALALAALTGCGAAKYEAEHKNKSVAIAVKGVGVETVSSAAVPETIEVTGTVRARTSAVVAARIPGTVSVLKVREGDRVSRGQVLARLEALENQATAAMATAGIEEAQRGLDEARSRKQLAESTFERYRRLFEEQAVTRQEFEVKQTEKELAVQGVARAEARLKQAREGSRAASAMADYTKIVAPISGIVTSKQADLGASVFPAQPLMTIEDGGSYQLELAVPESLASAIMPGSAVQVGLDALGSPFAARIAEIVPASDPASHTFIAKISLNRKGLKSGMFGRGTISAGTTASTLLLPRKGIFERGALTSVWVLEKDNTARMRLVKLGRTMGERVEILAGLSDGERVVVSGVEKVSEGARVE